MIAIGIEELEIVDGIEAAISVNRLTLILQIYMGSKWKSHPNMASWHDSEEAEGSEHKCFHLKVNPNDYHPNGHDTLELELQARLTVELYYAFQDAVRRGGPEERNEYRRLYQAWHPQSYEFRHFRAFGFAQKENNECQITIREEEYEETNERHYIIRQH